MVSITKSVAVFTHGFCGEPVKTRTAKPLVISAADAVKVGVNVFAFRSVPVPVCTVHKTDAQLAEVAPESTYGVVHMVASGPAFTSGFRIKVTTF
jgi:hypothetical protein